MSNKKVLIVEDDISSMNALEKMVKEINVLAVCFKASNLEHAYRFLHENVIDVFILDIILDTNAQGDVSGMKLAEEIRRIERYRFTPIIFISALSDPRYHAYTNIRSCMYIEKPFHIEETKSVLREAMFFDTEPEKDKHLYFRKDGILFSVKESEVVYIESKTHKLYIHSTRETISIPYKTCKGMTEILDSSKFVKCSRSTIVNKEYIKTIDVVNRYIGVNSDMGYDKITISAKYLKDMLKDINVC